MTIGILQDYEKTVSTNGRNNEVELGYAIKPEYWGKGIVVEISLISIELAFDVLSLSELICFTRTQNSRSLRVMKKLGFHYEKDFIYMDIPQKLHRLNALSLIF